MVTAHINRKMLTWARERAGLEPELLAKGSITLKKIKAWEAGDEYPTQNQAIALAEKLGISYAMLFMPVAPSPDDPPIPDLRTVSGQQLKNPSLAFREVLSTALIRQDWIREERLDQGAKKLSFVGRFKLTSDPGRVAADMRKELKLLPEDRAECVDYEAFIKHLVSHSEQMGLLVMRSAIVGHDTRRKLDVNEFRGFALSDHVAPAIFINDADAKAAQVFTLAHELAHIWIGADGVSDRRPNQQQDSLNAIEVFCDKVAAEVLVPEAEFIKIWRGGETTTAAKHAAQYFRVSTLVALRRAKDLGRITQTNFIEAVNAEYARFRELDRKKREKQKEKEARGGNFWASFEIRNGRALNNAVVQAISSNRATYTEAATLLGVNIGSTIRYLRRAGVQ